MAYNKYRVPETIPQTENEDIPTDYSTAQWNAYMEAGCVPRCMRCSQHLNEHNLSSNIILCQKCNDRVEQMREQ